MNVPLIFIADPIPSFNKGEWAILEGIIYCLKKQYNDLQFVLISRDPNQDSVHYKNLCKVININNWFLILLNYLRCNAVIVGHDSSISYSSICIGKILHKPVIIYAGSLSKYKSWLRKNISKYLLKKVNLIMFREKVSLDMAQKMGISNVPMYLVADVAFLLEPCSEEDIKKIIENEIGESTNKLVGVTLTREMCEYSNLFIHDVNVRYQKAVKIKAKILDYMVEKYKAKIIFLPHSIGPGKLDDRKVAEDVITEMKYHSSAKSITKDYTPSELKGLISKCWIFIGERTHSVIGALSQGVPSLCLTHSSDVRTHGIIGEMLEQRKYVYNIDKLDENEIILLIEELIKEHERVKDELRSKIGEITEKALLSGKLFCEHVLKKESSAFWRE